MRDQSQNIYSIGDVRDVITAMTKHLSESMTPIGRLDLNQPALAY